MDKRVFKITSHGDSDSLTYWRKKSYVERLEALEQLRQIIFGYDPATTRFQKTLTITELKKN